MVQTRSQAAQQSKEAQSPTHLEEETRVSLWSSQKIPSCVPTIGYILWELYLEELEIHLVQRSFEEDTRKPTTPQSTNIEYDHTLIEARRRLIQLRMPPASPHIHNLSPYGTHYDLDELPLESHI